MKIEYEAIRNEGLNYTKSKRRGTVLGYHAIYCGWTGTGPTKEAALKDMERQIHTSAGDSGQLRVLRYKDRALLMWRVMGEMRYKVVDADLSTASYYGVDYTELQAYMALAQQGWDGETEPPGFLPRELHDDWHRWVDFQTTYRLAQRCHFTPSECHAIGCNNSHVPYPVDKIRRMLTGAAVRCTEAEVETIERMGGERTVRLTTLHCHGSTDMMCRLGPSFAELEANP
jgi:hypothetical protein